MKKILRKILTLITLTAGLLAVAHEGKKHAGHKKPVTVEEKSAYQIINEHYISEVKPIFQKKCFDCHGTQTSFPWYRNLPGAKQLIQHDLEEAKEHLNMEPDFPFKSHATPVEDLDAVLDSSEKNEMPPFRYRVLHSGSSLTDEEKDKVRKWVQFAKDVLKEKPIKKESP